jgi:hypothetical protein
VAHTITRDSRGSQGQLGYKGEAVYGTAEVVDLFLPAVLPIGLKPRIGVLETKARIPGRIAAPHSRNVHFDDGGEGPLTFELTQEDLLVLLKWATGDDPTDAAQGGTAAYLHTYVYDVAAAKMDAALTSMTFQTGVPMYGGAVEPFTFSGCICTGFEVSAESDGFAQIAFNVEAQKCVHTADLAAPTYPTTHVPFSWRSETVVKRAAAALDGVRSAKFSLESGVTTDRRLWDATGLRARPKLNGDPVAKLELEIEPADLTKTYDDWASNTGRAWVMEFVGAAAAAGYDYTFRITIADGYIQGEPPEDNSDELLTHSLVVQANDNGTDPLFKIEVINLATSVA